MRNYRMLTTLLAPLVPLWIYYRAWRGKEDKARIQERFGTASKPRPPGMLMWIHGASVGEANSVLPFLERMLAAFPDINILMTTGTVTSARLMARRLPKEIIHQYAPIDTPDATQKFIRHWKPDFAFWIESEFWPNLIYTTDDFGSMMCVINARMSESSFRSWQKRARMIKSMLSSFDIMFAQSDDDAARLRALGARETIFLGNIKYDAPKLNCDENELLALKTAVGVRPVWLAASTHPGEEKLIAEAHQLLSVTRPNLLTIIVPRHADRGDSIAEELKKSWKVSLRSKKEPIAADTQIYIANTMGELGLFYRLSEIVFMGGSLVKHGGQNPLEPAKLSCAVIAGPHTHNFSDIYAEMEAIGGALRVNNSGGLAAEVDRLLNDPKARDALQNAMRGWLKTKGGATDRLLETLTPAFEIKEEGVK